jgi:ribonuclease VapC
MRSEPGAELVGSMLPSLCISAVNLAEVLSKFVEYGKTLEDISHQVERLRIPCIPFDEVQAKVLASLWKPTRKFGLSLGDRACLALGLGYGCPVLTADRKWAECGLGVEIIPIR